MKQTQCPRLVVVGQGGEVGRTDRKGMATMDQMEAARMIQMGMGAMVGARRMARAASLALSTATLRKSWLIQGGTKC